jgi:hypothetical protein
MRFDSEAHFFYFTISRTRHQSVFFEPSATTMQVTFTVNRAVYNMDDDVVAWADMHLMEYNILECPQVRSFRAYSYAVNLTDVMSKRKYDTTPRLSEVSTNGRIPWHCSPCRRQKSFHPLLVVE